MPNQVLRQFGARIRVLRQQKGLTQEALALQAGLDRTYVGGVERGERNISLQNVAKLATALGVSLDHLFRGLRV